MAEQINTAFELDERPIGTVVLDRDGDSWTKVDDTERTDEYGDRLPNAWASVMWKSDRTAAEMVSGNGTLRALGPFTVVSQPDRDFNAEAREAGAREAWARAVEFLSAHLTETVVREAKRLNPYGAEPTGDDRG